MKIEIERLGTDDLNKFTQLIQLFQEVFEMKNFTRPEARHLQTNLERQDFLVFVAQIDTKIVGGLTAYVLHQYYSTKPLAYIFDLAVDTTLQRRGIGKKLITDFREFCQREGFEEVFVQADQIEQYALDFYRSTNPTEEEKVVHFYYTL